MKTSTTIKLSIIFLLTAFCMTRVAHGQVGNWEDNAALPQTWTNGFVGVGTSAPAVDLHVLDGVSRFGASLNYGQFDVSGNLRFFGTGKYLVPGNTYAFKAPGVNSNIGLYFNSANSRIEFRDAAGTRMSSTDVAGATPGNGYFSGSLAIGTTIPQGKVHSVGSDVLPSFFAGTGGADFAVADGEGIQFGNWNSTALVFTERIRITSEGRLGVGTVGPEGMIHSAGTGSTPSFFAGGSTADLAVGDGQNMQFGHWNDATSIFTERMRISGGGAVGIGVTVIPAGYELAVNGKVICEEVLVELSANWPDHVFEEDYQLMSLADLEKQIAENKHLPGIPSALEVASNGVTLGDMQSKLLEKIEELTLYVIEAKKENEALKDRVASLERNKQ